MLGLCTNLDQWEYLTNGRMAKNHVECPVHTDRDESDEMYAEFLTRKKQSTKFERDHRCVPLGFNGFSARLFVLNSALIRASRSSSSSSTSSI